MKDDSTTDDGILLVEEGEAVSQDDAVVAGVVDVVEDVAEVTDVAGGERWNAVVRVVRVEVASSS